MSKIVCLSGANADYEYELPAEDSYEITFGRSDENDICVLDRKSSRFHCKIVFSKDEMRLEDLGSTNGVVVNNVPVAGNTRISYGDFVVIGQTVFAVLKDDTDLSTVRYDNTASVMFEHTPMDKKSLFEATNTTAFRRMKTEQRGIRTGFLTFFEKKNQQDKHLS